MADHRFKTSFGQCRCLWCGNPRPGGWQHCSVDDPMRAALKKWYSTHGRNWKSKLVAAWMAGEDVGQELQHLRNVIGPTRLMAIPTYLVD